MMESTASYMIIEKTSLVDLEIQEIAVFAVTAVGFVLRRCTARKKTARSKLDYWKVEACSSPDVVE